MIAMENGYFPAAVPGSATGFGKSDNVSSAAS